LHTVNPQLEINPRFALRNRQLSIGEASQTAYVAVKLRRNTGGAGPSLLGVGQQEPILHCKIILRLAEDLP
jgi:hypothetical protein